jgi:hypothetical protein
MLCSTSVTDESALSNFSAEEFTQEGGKLHIQGDG